MFSAPYGHCHSAVFSAPYVHSHSGPYHHSAVVMNIPVPRMASRQIDAGQSLLPFQHSAVPKILQRMSTAINPQPS